MNPDNAIEVRAYTPCSGTNYFPVDSTIRDSLYVFVDTTVTGSNPTLALYDPKGAPHTVLIMRAPRVTVQAILSLQRKSCSTTRKRSRFNIQ